MNNVLLHFAAGIVVTLITIGFWSMIKEAAMIVLSKAPVRMTYYTAETIATLFGFGLILVLLSMAIETESAVKKTQALVIFSVLMYTYMITKNILLRKGLPYDGLALPAYSITITCLILSVFGPISKAFFSLFL